MQQTIEAASPRLCHSAAPQQRRKLRRIVTRETPKGPSGQTDVNVDQNWTPFASKIGFNIRPDSAEHEAARFFREISTHDFGELRGGLTPAGIAAI